VKSGRERVGVGSIHRMKLIEPWDAGRDLMFHEGEGEFFTLEAGSFAIFLPQDVHKPSLLIERPEPVTKVVMKVRL